LAEEHNAPFRGGELFSVLAGAAILVVCEIVVVLYIACEILIHPSCRKERIMFTKQNWRSRPNDMMVRFIFCIIIIRCWNICVTK